MQTQPVQGRAWKLESSHALGHKTQNPRLKYRRRPEPATALRACGEPTVEWKTVRRGRARACLARRAEWRSPSQFGMTEQIEVDISHAGGRDVIRASPLPPHSTPADVCAHDGLPRGQWSPEPDRSQLVFPALRRQSRPQKRNEFQRSTCRTQTSKRDLSW